MLIIVIIITPLYLNSNRKDLGIARGNSFSIPESDSHLHVMNHDNLSHHPMYDLKYTQRGRRFILVGIVVVEKSDGPTVWGLIGSIKCM